MTREEAIFILRGKRDISGEKTAEALDIAIKALEQEPCEDAISRQDVLDMMNYGILEDNIETIPPVTPQPKIGQWVKTPKAVMGEGYMWYCDKCEHQVYQDSSRDYPSENYCPKCGAKMVEQQEREDNG